jgi:uncharacterized LabA/DUF88 family protein
LVGFFIFMRTAVFIDYQNVYMRARHAFVALGAEHWHGQIDPRIVGERIVGRAAGQRTLELVRVYRGLPDGSRDPKGHAACSRQVEAWRRLPGVEVFTRPLRYPQSYPAERPTEKGIDVQLAVDFVTLAIDRKFDVGVIFSADTDMKPALEAARRLTHATVEVAAWKPPSGYAQRISISGASLWCHYLNEHDYAAVADRTNYASRS